MEQVKIKDICALYENDGIEPVKRIALEANGTTICVNCKPSLDLAERSKMVREIAEMPFVEDKDGRIVYAPYIKTFAMGYFVIKYFTNIDVDSDDLEYVWRSLENSPIVDKIVDTVGREYIDSILQDADELIEYKKSMNLKKTKFDEVLDKIAGIVETVKCKVDGVDVDNILSKFEEAFPEWKDEIAKALVEHKVDTQE
jgi:hypothetical protein